MLTHIGGLESFCASISSVPDVELECRVISQLELVDVVVKDLVTSELLESRSAVE
jgi:hypothetical protein